MKKAELAKVKGLHFTLLMVAFLTGGFIFSAFFMPIPLKNASVVGTIIFLTFLIVVATLHELRDSWPK